MSDHPPSQESSAKPDTDLLKARLSVQDDSSTESKKPSYNDLYNKYQKSFLSTNVSLNASFFIERQKMIERYNRYAKYETQNYLRRFIASDKFWTTMSNSLIAYDKILK